MIFYKKKNNKIIFVVKLHKMKMKMKMSMNIYNFIYKKQKMIIILDFV